MNAAQILYTVSDITGVPVSSMLSPTRTRTIADARHLAYKAIYEFTNSSLKATAEAVGRSNHATVLNGIKEIEGFIDIDMTVCAFWEKIKETLSGEAKDAAVEENYQGA